MNITNYMNITRAGSLFRDPLSVGAPIPVTPMGLVKFYTVDAGFVKPITDYVVNTTTCIRSGLGPETLVEQIFNYLEPLVSFVLENPGTSGAVLFLLAGLTVLGLGRLEKFIYGQENKNPQVCIKVPALIAYLLLAVGALMVFTSSTVSMLSLMYSIFQFLAV